MKNNTYVTSLIFFLSVLIANAQTNDFYYTVNNEKIHLIKIEGKSLVEFPIGLSTTTPLSGPGIKLTDKTFIVSNLENLSGYDSPYLLTPTYITDDGIELNYSREILLKFNSNTSPSLKSNLISSNNLILVKSELTYDMYHTTGDALQVSKTIYLSGLVEFCTPNFIIKVENSDVNSSETYFENSGRFDISNQNISDTNISPESYIPNDEYFNKQWYLHNTGQGTNDGKTTLIDADIDAPEVWDITKGNASITIAVIDRGVTSNHPDLPNTRQIRLNGSNFDYLNDGTNNPNDPSPTLSSTIQTTISYNHGNACAGIISATQDNNIGITGVAPFCKIMPIKIPFGSVAVSIVADAINFAVTNNADIISNSWNYSSTNSNFQPVIVAALNNAITNNKIVVFSAGNTADRIGGGENAHNGYIAFPANADIPNLIAVGASDRNNTVANYSPNGFVWGGNSNYRYRMSVCAPSHSAYNSQIPGETGNIWTIDMPGNNYGSNSWKDNTSGLPVFGELLPSTGTNFSSYTGRMGGTSASAPQVAGVLALMKSVNSCASISQMKDIIQLTADKIGGFNYNFYNNQPGISLELGYGKINAFKAVQLAQHMTEFDLVVKDSYNDSGMEPNNDTQYMWASENIWVRNTGNLTFEHQNPIYYGNNTPNYVRVRVKNNSCITSTGNEQLNVYWAKASTGLSWPNPWNGGVVYPPTNASMGGSIGIQNIPILQPGQEAILSFPWIVPNPADYGNVDQWHFCLLSRIVAPNDPMTFAETWDINANTRNNNNIAWKNVTVVIPPSPITNPLITDNEIMTGAVAVGNPFNETKAFILELVKEDLEDGKPIYDEAEVSVKMDNVLFNAWSRGGKLAQRVEETLDEKRKIVKGNNVLLDNIVFNPNETGILNLKFNFLTQELTEKSKFTYHIIQKDALTGVVIGGETFVIKKQVREPFIADAGGDKIVDKNQTITISAEQINEAAIYNWYDIDGNLVFTGKDITISADVAKKYKLEVIATADGFKDYTEINVNLKPNTLEIISPNPASNSVNISYKLNDVNSAYLMVLGSYGTDGASNNYILDVNSTDTNIDVTNYQNGLYTVALVCNGQIIDAKTLVKQ